MTMYTPGPWRTVCPPSMAMALRYICAESGESFGQSVVCEIGTTWAVDQDVGLANARLIASAPTLVEALAKAYQIDNPEATPQAVLPAVQP